MTPEMNRRSFLKDSLTLAAGGALAAHLGGGRASAEDAPPKAPAAPGDALQQGKIGKLQISRMLLGGNLLSHYTHSRDLNYVYALAAHYNTEAKILETLALAEENGINTMSMHNPPLPMKLLGQHRKRGGKLQWIICPTANIAPDMKDHEFQVKELVDQGADAIYIWGVRSDPLVSQGKVDLIAKAVEVAKKMGVPCGVGCHDLNVVVQCEKAQVPCDFYIKTFHHHNYPSAPRPDQVKGPLSETPGYWCADPKAHIEVMKTVEKPWFAFKVMAAGAIPPEKAFRYCFESGADHLLVGMFDFEIAQDVKIAKKALEGVKRERPWRS